MQRIRRVRQQIAMLVRYADVGITESVFGLNRERFWLEQRAFLAWRRRDAASWRLVEATPVSQKRVGLNRQRRTAMGVVVVRRRVRRVLARFGMLVPTLFLVRRVFRV